MSSEPSQTPADIPLESSFETAIGLPGPDETGPTKVTDRGPLPPPPAEQAAPGGFTAGSVTNIMPGSQAAAKPSDRPPTIPDVTLEKALGQGGMGTVYKGRQITLDRAVAVKAIHPNLAKDRTFVDRFEREAKVLAKLSHANIVTCYAAGTCRETGKHYLLMEYVEGEDLLKRVRKSGPLGERDALIIAKQVAEGLEHALEAGVIHRDVKPENILLKPIQGRTATSLGVQAKIVDLGLAALAQPDKEALRLTEAGTALGTPLTMAPEQAEAPDSIDHRVDIYALGCTLFFALTGRFPHEGTTIAQVLSKKLRDETPDPKTLRPELGDSTAKLILQMMSFAPASRPASYEQLVAQLDAEIARLPGPSTGRLPSARLEPPAASAAPAKDATPPARSPLKLVAGALAVAALTGAGLLHWRSEPRPAQPAGVPTAPPVAPPTQPPPPVAPPTQPAPPVAPPAPPLPSNALDAKEPPRRAWGDSHPFFLNASGPKRFENVDLGPRAKLWKKPGDDDDFNNVDANISTDDAGAVAWFRLPLEPAVRIEGDLYHRELTEESGVRLEFATGTTIDVALDCMDSKDPTNAEVGRQWKLLIADPKKAALSFHDGEKGRSRSLEVIVAGGVIWARLRDVAKPAWIKSPAPGPLKRVGLHAAKGTVSFDKFAVLSAHD